MRSFCIQGPFGLNVSFNTSIPGALAVSFPFRSKSAPPLYTADSPMDVDAPPFASVPDLTATIPADRLFVNDTSGSQKRPPSPTPTDVFDPEPEHVLRDIQARGIKVRDFAYEPSKLAPVVETFNVEKALADYEYRIAQSPRTFPITGRTLDRLLELGVITLPEAEERCAPMDFEELKKHRSQAAYPYPWKPYEYHWSGEASVAVRQKALKMYSTMFMSRDKLLAVGFAEIKYREEEQALIEKTKESIRQRDEDARLRALGISPSKKRINPDDAEGTDSKRQRMSPEFEEGCSSQPFGSYSQSQSQPKPISQPKFPYSAMIHTQYPAPLCTYDPEIYPDAAATIEAHSQSQPRGVVPPRVDTPPLREDTPPPGALTRPKKGLKRTLSRTQTFTQL